MKTNATLSFAFSALGDRLPQLLPLVELLANHQSTQVIVVVQRWKDEDQQGICTLPNVTYVWDEGVGLSRSRNLALEQVTGDYVWLLDDDVQITTEDVDALLAEISAAPDVDFFRVKIGCIEWHDKFFKTYKKLNKVGRLNLLQVSSIEIIGRTEFVNKHQIRFNENIGLGTPYQGAEEIHFMIDAYDAGASINFIDRVFVRHTCIFEERVLATKNIFTIRGATASRFGLLGPVLLLRWALRYLITVRKPSYIFAMFKGYFKGYRSFVSDKAS